MTLTTVQALAARRDDPELLVLDASVALAAPAFDGDYRVASGLAGWQQAHIPGSRHADLLVELADVDRPYSFAVPAPAQLAVGLQRLGVTAQRVPVLYDSSDGFWAARLWWMLHALGLPAQVLDGGFAAWRQAGLPVATASAPAPIAMGDPSPIRPRADAWASRDQVQAIMAGRAPGTLVCALSQGLFLGDAVTRYARRGRIPGSYNLPARQLFDAQGRYLPEAELAAALGTLLTAPGPLVIYCGGGISAAVNALALTRLGRQDVALYDGSLQEWAADPTLPLLTGRPLSFLPPA